MTTARCIRTTDARACSLMRLSRRPDVHCHTSGIGEALSFATAPFVSAARVRISPE